MYPPVVLRRLLLQPAQSVSENAPCWHGVSWNLYHNRTLGLFFKYLSQSHHLLPVCCSWRCHVTCQLFCTVHDVSSVNGKKIGSCCQCSIPSGSGRAQNLSDQWLFLHAQLSQLSFLQNVVCLVSHLFLAYFGHGDLEKCQIGCSCFADDCFCMFLVCFTRFPDSIMPTELSIQYFHLLRHSWFVPKCCSVDFQLRLQLVSHPNKIHWFSRHNDVVSVHKTFLKLLWG